MPAWSGLASIVLVVNSTFTYAEVEVNAVHVDELRNPGRDYPESLCVAIALVLAVFILPTLAIGCVISGITSASPQASCRPSTAS